MNTICGTCKVQVICWVRLEWGVGEKEVAVCSVSASDIKQTVNGIMIHFFLILIGINEIIIHIQVECVVGFSG